MLSVKRFSVLAVLFAFLFAVALAPVAADDSTTEASVSVTHQQTDIAQQIKQYFSGRAFVVSWRQGGAVYGTYYFAQVAFCGSGVYTLDGHGERTTILDNTQYYNWQEQGDWDVVMYQGTPYLVLEPSGGSPYSAAIQLLSDGGISFPGISIIEEGPATCR
jgi:hypothetical protein